MTKCCIQFCIIMRCVINGLHSISLWKTKNNVINTYHIHWLILLPTGNIVVLSSGVLSEGKKFLILRKTQTD